MKNYPEKSTIELRREEKRGSKGKKGKTPEANGDKKTEPAFFILEVSDNGVELPENIRIEDSEPPGLQLVSILVEQLEGELELKTFNGTEFVMRFAVLED